jgi:hypothetical protein
MGKHPFRQKILILRRQWQGLRMVAARISMTAETLFDTEKYAVTMLKDVQVIKF